jgi:predicted RNA-binding Zn-ribbon protein involved in translation (DUF1610 family)
MESKLIRFFCCQCGGKVKVNGRLAGKIGRCPTCGSAIVIPADTESRALSGASQPQSLDRDLAEPQRCDSCGTVLSSIATACPACGNELYRKNASSCVDDLRRQLAAVEAELRGFDAHKLFEARVHGRYGIRKAAIIEMFTVPNNKDVILELLSLSTSNGDANRSGTVDGDNLRAAWRAKAKQMLGKAQVFAERDSEYRRILAPFEATINSWPRRDRKEWTWIAVALAAILIFILILAKNVK